MMRQKYGPVPGDILAALDELGIRYVVKGDEAQARCPAHNDRHPSWSCNIITGQHNCFSCGFGGSFMRLAGHIMGLDPEDAAQWVRKRGGVERARAALSDESPSTTGYRHIYTEADLALFTCPPRKALASRRLTSEACAAYGVLWDPEQERWILPIRDPHTGKLWGWQEKADGCFRNRPRGVPKSDTLFGFHRLVPGCRAVLVESPLDAVRLLAAGVDHAVASYGAMVSERQVSLLLERCNSLLCALDNDDAGWARAGWLIKHTPRNFRLHFFDYSGCRGKDPGELDDRAISMGVTRAFSALRARI